MNHFALIASGININTKKEKIYYLHIILMNEETEKFLKQYKKSNKDVLRVQLFKYLQIHNLTITKRDYFNFYNFINNEENDEMLSIYLNVLIGMYSKRDSLKILDDLIIEYDKLNKLYTFKQLYQIDPNWHEYYKENTDVNGIKKKKERRKGVKKDYVNDVMKIKRLIEYNTKSILELEKAMLILEFIRSNIYERM
jgi:hypothetical protein